MSFKNKSVIITGAGQGIGYEIAKQLASKGANIILNDVDAEMGEAAVESLKELDGEVIYLDGDAGDLAVIDDLIAAAVQNFGKLDFAIANAGITTYNAFLEYKKEQLDKLLQVNIHGSFFLAQRVAKQFIKQKSGGKILMLSSTTGLRPHIELEAYGMTKAAIAFLAKSLGTQLAPMGINVNCISPGATATERTTETEGFEKGWAELIPTRKVSTTKNIADAALFLLSDAANQITGQNMVVDGGWTNLGPMPEAI